MTYTIDVSNFGPGDAQNVVLTDTIPPEITGAEFSTDGGVTFNPWPGSLSIGTLLNQETRTIIIRGTVAPVAAGFITNTAEVTSTTPDPNPSNNTSTSVIEVNESTEEADVGVFKSVGLNPVPAGEVVVFQIKVSNFGPAAAQNVVLTDTIPPEITGAEFSTDGGSTFNPWPGTLDIGTLIAGETINILIRGTVSPTATGIISNTAEVTSTTPDPNPSNNTSTVDVEVIAPVVADVAVVKTASPNPVMAGEILTYTINVTNFGPASSENVTLTDVIPPEITGVEFSTDGGVTFSPWPGTLNIGTLLNGEIRTILIRGGTVSPSATGIISNTATVTSTTPDPNPNNNTSTVEVEVSAPVVADVGGVVKTGSPNPVMSGDTLTYTIVVSNFGPSSAENVTLSDVIPPEITGAEFSTDGGVTFSPWPGSLNIGTLLNGETRTILIRGTVAPVAPGFIINTAIVTSTTPDPNLSNNTSTSVIEVNESTEEADVGVFKSVETNPVTPGGGMVVYSIRVSNFGPAAAQNVVLTDVIPPEITGAEFSIDGGLTFNPWPGALDIGTLPAGQTITILIRGTVSPSATGIISNTATVTSTTPDPNPSNNTSTVDVEVIPVVGEADISVVKTASPNPVAPGEVLTYTLVVSNAGPNDAQNVIVNDNVSSSIIGPEFSIDGGVTFNPWPGSIDIGTLPVGESRTVIIRGTVSQSATGCINNTANVISSTPDPNPNNNTSTVNTEINVVTVADVSVVKASNFEKVCPGSMLVYTIVVSNSGPADAENVMLEDNIPFNIKVAEYSIDGGATWNAWSGSYNLGTLAAGTSETILIRGKATSSNTGYIVNTAKVTSMTEDPNLTNNVSTDITKVGSTQICRKIYCFEDRKCNSKNK